MKNLSRILTGTIFTAILATPLCAADRELEAQILVELNDARANPSGYAKTLREYRSHFRDKVVLAPGETIGTRTNEGVAAVDEAIAFLERQSPLGPLVEAPALVRAATDHVAAQGPSGLTGHAGPDGSTLGERVGRHGLRWHALGETISYASDTATEVVRQLIVDDGVPSRGHRAIIFAPVYDAIGIACGPHARHQIMCVLDFSAE